MTATRRADPFRIDARHPRVALFVRMGTGIWLLTLTAILFRRHRDRWLALLLGPSAALHFYLAHRLRSSARG